MKRSTIRKKAKTVSQLKKQLDAVFSKWVRRRDNNVCYTCGRRFDLLQAGHFISRQHNATRYDEDNVHAQCVACNVWKRGNVGVYAERLLKELGEVKFKELLALGRSTKQWTVKELEGLIVLYNVKSVAEKARIFSTEV